MDQTATMTLPATRPAPRVQQPRLWNVVLLNDDDHSYEYVIELSQRLFGCSKERGYQMAKTVDSQGRAVCMTTHRELGELKVEQVHSFGPDRLIASSKGSMSALLEPAEFGDDAGDSQGGE
jgi:ATP-dependent Clp protease adaptor protein ClpS